MAGKRAKASEDLRYGKYGDDMRPGVLQMLFKGGPARATGAMDLRTGRNSAKPRPTQMLFRGGQTADMDIRVGHEDGLEPDEHEMLSDGGEAGECSEECLMAAEDIMDVLGGGFYSDRPNDSDNKVERASKEASRRAKAKMLAEALRAFFLAVDED